MGFHCSLGCADIPVALELDDHRVLLALTLDEDAGAGHPRQGGDKRGHLLGTHEHPLDLRRLIGPAHPAFDPHVGAATGAFARHDRAEVSGREADQRIIGVQRRHHDFADFALLNRVAGSRRDDLDHHAFIDDHPLHRRALIGDIAQIGGGVVLQAGDAPVRILLTQRREQRPAAHDRLGDGKRHALFIGPVQDHLQEIRRARIGRHADIRRRTHLKVGLADARGHHRRAHRCGAAFEDHSGRRQMVGEAVLHDVARTDPGGMEEPPDPPPVGRCLTRLVDRTRRLEDVAHRMGRRHCVAAERRGLRLRLAQRRFPQHG